MLDSMYVLDGIREMQQVEKRISELCNGEHGRCSLLNSADYIQLRLAALYPQTYGYNKHMQVTKNRIRIVLENRTIFLYCDYDDPTLEDEQKRHCDDLLTSDNTKKSKY